jgi:anaerobic nitric oxide reductase transcription regulator
VISRASLRAFREQRRGARWTAIEPHHLALEAAAAAGPATPSTPPAPMPTGQHAGLAGATLREATEAFQRAWLADALARHRGHVANAAREAGIDRSNFHRTLRKLGVPRPGGTP